MNGWCGELRQLVDNGERAVLVTVAATRGSTPREVGAKMVVTKTTTIGSIGGGQLEYQCTQEACQWLAKGSKSGKSSRTMLRKFVLSANCGQCCGGVADILFEEVGRADVGRIEQLSASRDLRSRIVIFGAGHVGSACAAVLSTLDVNIDLIDSRAGFLDDRLPTNIAARELADPAGFVATVPENSYFLVMTHDHGLDFDICARILQRTDIAYCGLIGSRSKRRRFEKRFRELGITEKEISQLTCPIGIDEIKGKKPAEIAIAVAAQLQHLFEAGVSVPNSTGTHHLELVRGKSALAGGN